jgi:hypothetical protein
MEKGIEQENTYEYFERNWRIILREHVYYPNVKPRGMEDLNKYHHMRWFPGIHINNLIINGKRINLKPDENHYHDVAPYLRMPFSSIEYALAVSRHERKRKMHILHLIEGTFLPRISNNLPSKTVSHACRIPVFEDELKDLTSAIHDKLPQESVNVELEHKLKYGKIFLGSHKNTNYDVIGFDNIQLDRGGGSFGVVSDEWEWGYMLTAKGPKGILGEIGKLFEIYVSKL